MGLDEVPAEIIKLLDEGGIAVLKRIFNKIFESVHYPTQWVSSIFIPLPKKNNARECENHRLISLMSHTLKIFLEIIQQRISIKCEKTLITHNLVHLGTREALVATQVPTSTKLSRYEERRSPMLH